MHTRILLEIGMPEQPSHERQEAPCLSIEDRVRDALDMIDSGHESSVEWLMINKLHKALRERKQTPRVRNLLKMIEPVMAKYGYYGVGKEK